jgi:tetratricopeptide (TPR) repeat protein
MKNAFIFLAIAVLLIVVIVLLIPPRPRPPELVPSASAPALTAEELQMLIQRKNLAVGLLENGKLDEANVELEQLVKEWPAELVGVQDLAILRLLEIEKAKTPGDRLAAISRARMAIQQLVELTPDSEAPYVLAGRVAVLADDQETALNEFAKAARVNPDNASTWYECREAWNEFGDTVPDQVRAGLQKSFELAPDNLWVLHDWWTVQLKSRDPQIMQTLETLRPMLATYSERIQELYHYDVMEMLQTALDQAAAEDWDGLRTSLRMLWNVVYADDAAHSDQNQIKRHPLAFVVSDFSDEFYAQAPPIPAQEHPAGTLVFHAVDAPFSEFEAGVIRDGVLEDFDLDGRLDLCLLQEGSVVVLGRAAGSDAWSVTASREVPGDWRGMLLVDVDDDREAPVAASSEEFANVQCQRADLDVVLFGESGLSVLRNDKAEDSTERSLNPIDAFGDTPPAGAVALCMAVDADMDGDLDLLAADDSGLQLYSNRGNSSFRRRDHSILGFPEGITVNSAVPVDFDRDIDVDVLVTTTDGGVGMLENLRHGNLRWRALSDWSPAGRNASAIDIVEADGNVSWDVLVGSPFDLTLHRTQTPARGEVQPMATSRLDAAAPHLIVADLDNDSFDEVLCWTEQQATLVDCQPDGKLVSADGSGLELSEGAHMVAADYGDLDRDGDLDVLVLTDQGIQLFDNAPAPPSDWVDVELVAEQADETQGVSSGRVNHYALGSLIELKAGRAYRAKVARRPRTHFGLGSLGDPDVLRVVWTTGTPENLLQPERNQFICERQTLFGSCPYLYTWNGKRHEFVTDLCWAGPLGLPSSQGGWTPHRDWEYLKIDGGMLAEDNGVYRLQVTEELWEAAYFDQVQLLAIDHPREVSIYSNEKVGPPEISQYMIHTVREPRSPVAARDQRGRDVLSEIAAEDDVYLRLHDGKITQGYTHPTFLELDLGDLNDPQRITLFLTGWLYPTDAGINTALAENPSLPGPRPPAILVPAESGEWTEAMPYMGFPGGKTKTIAVDISDIFPTDDYRLRIVTDMELYWDHIFFTVDEAPAEFVERDLELVSADLHFRGVSAFTPHPHNGPDRYHYDLVTPAPRYAPMGGAFTRFGDVGELITTADDRLLVMGCGDECTLEFAVPEGPLPEGWTRDFIMHNIGWDKDANMHTVCGQTVEPMPYRNMQTYPYRPESFPGGPKYEQYLRTYQTRRFEDGYFRRALAARNLQAASKP